MSKKKKHFTKYLVTKLSVKEKNDYSLGERVFTRREHLRRIIMKIIF
jgi:hypothetical protein